MYKNIDSNDDLSKRRLSKNRHIIRKVPYCLPADIIHSLNKEGTIIVAKDVLSPLSSSKINSPNFLKEHRVCRGEYCLPETCSLKKEIVADSNENLPISPSKISSLPFSRNWRRVPCCLPEGEVYTKKELKSIVKKCFANIKKNTAKQTKEMQEDVNLKDYIITDNISDFIQTICFSGVMPYFVLCIIIQDATT